MKLHALSVVTIVIKLNRPTVNYLKVKSNY